MGNEAALEAVVREAGGSVDVVIASDVLYDIEGAVSFARICRRLLIGDNNDAGGCREGDEGKGRIGSFLGFISSWPLTRWQCLGASTGSGTGSTGLGYLINRIDPLSHFVIVRSLEQALTTIRTF